MDAHVHLHDAFDAAAFARAAVHNFRRAASDLEAEATGCLLFTESTGHDAFARLVDGRLPDWPSTWRIQPVDGGVAAIATPDDEARFVMVAGRQIATAERLEVLALGTTSRFHDGEPLQRTLESVHRAGALAVIPWGFGKWWFERRRILHDLLHAMPPGSFYLGDHAGRPAVGRAPRLLDVAHERGIWNLPGTDPLPLRWQVGRVGSYGFFVPCAPDLYNPWTQLRTAIAAARQQPVLYGRRETMLRFARAQTEIRLRRRP